MAGEVTFAGWMEVVEKGKEDFEMGSRIGAATNGNQSPRGERGHGRPPSMTPITLVAAVSAMRVRPRRAIGAGD
jgi:hypothetical protein